MNLPFSDNLPTNKLASSFANTSATYKFYWLIAIIELVENGQTSIKKRDVFSRMISNSWYTVNYFHVSFGKQDLIQNAVEDILKFESLAIDIKKDNLISILENSKKIETKKSLEHFNLNVPHWFLSPWFPKLKDENNSNYKKRIYSSSQKFENNCLYALHDEFIEINPVWINYLKSNAKILKDFGYWNLSLFLQTRNPNVPDIPNKLIKPPVRNGLTKQTNEYWKIVFKELGSIECIFSGTKLYFDEKNFAIDHFIPHAFVSHDLIWNLIPIEKITNSKKSDNLPLFNQHFDKFYDLQKVAFEINKHHNSKSKYMDEYLSIFPNIDSFEKEKFSNTIQPLITIASNNGFLYMKNE
ncbi:HNH endonuclease domain-containing protein [Flavobacterium sp. XS2P24]|uniref:HNH endonuclease domain-containing protein n=1 Tax=Flavobacterium sp. XS2P24 TaxID=3041249 RepID=UPI0024A7B58A|nr:HNH endonuclease domain-containing protein [Flavobacterium sp. XS2P24]MDI6050649.1 HNH endonuclease domain-containing protein [Flavobacterium sp. XS2P24]